MQILEKKLYNYIFQLFQDQRTEAVEKRRK